MRGLSSTTGKALDGLAHITQSIGDILSTPLGSRVMRRDYGSRVPDLVDAPIGPSSVVDVTMAVADALDRWEPRVRLGRVAITEATAGGTIGLRLDITLTETGEQAVLEVAA